MNFSNSKREMSRLQTQVGRRKLLQVGDFLVKQTVAKIACNRISKTNLNCEAGSSLSNLNIEKNIFSRRSTYTQAYLHCKRFRN